VDLHSANAVLDAFVVGAVGIVSLRAAALADLRRVDDPADVATTRPHLAAAMLWLANPRIGEVAVDVACGAGTLVKEAVTFSREEYSSSSRGSTSEAPFPPRFALGGDVNIASAELCATTNVPAIGTNTSSGMNTSRVLADVCGWDASRLPLRAGVVDVALGDLPFGKAHLDHRSCARLYPRVLRELARILRVGGRAVLLGTRSKFNDALDALPLKVTTQRLVSKGGLVVLLVALERVPGDERARAPGGGGSLLRKKRHDPERLEARRARARGRGIAGEGREGGRSGRANGGEPTKNAASTFESI
jgi:SAM-dependent methyltransferase